MAKWKPPHPARQVVIPMKCRLGQRYASAERVWAMTTGPLAAIASKLHVTRCSWCQGGFHLVNADELSRYRNVLTEVTR